MIKQNILLIFIDLLCIISIYSIEHENRQFLEILPETDNAYKNDCVNFILDSNNLRRTQSYKKYDTLNNSPQTFFSETLVEDDVKRNQYKFYQLCIARHSHEHKVEIKAQSDQGEINLYISPNQMNPTKTTSSWISQKKGNKKVVLPTYLPDFPRDHGALTLYIGVYGITPGTTHYTLSASIIDIKTNEDIRIRRKFYVEESKNIQQLRSVEQSKMHNYFDDGL